MTPKQEQTCQKLDAMLALLREVDQTWIARSLVVRLEKPEAWQFAHLPLVASGFSAAFRADSWKR